MWASYNKKYEKNYFVFASLKSLKKGVESGSSNHRYGSVDPIPHQNVTDSQHCFRTVIDTTEDAAALSTSAPCCTPTAGRWSAYWDSRTTRSRQCCGSTWSTCFWASRIRIHLSEVWIRIRILLLSCKNSKKNLDSYYFVTLFNFLSLKNDVNVPSKNNKQKKLC